MLNRWCWPWLSLSEPGGSLYHLREKDDFGLAVAGFCFVQPLDQFVQICLDQLPTCVHRYVLGFVWPSAREHRCATDGGYEWCETLYSCVRPWEVPSGTCPGDPQDDSENGSVSSGSGDEAGLGLVGLWLAMAAGYAVVAAIAGIAVCRSDWEQILVAAAERSATKTKGATTNAAPTPIASSLHVRSLNRPSTAEGDWVSVESGASRDARALKTKAGKGLGASLLSPGSHQPSLR